MALVQAIFGSATRTSIGDTGSSLRGGPKPESLGTRQLLRVRVASCVVVVSWVNSNLVVLWRFNRADSLGVTSLTTTCTSLLVSIEAEPPTWI